MPDAWVQQLLDQVSALAQRMSNLEGRVLTLENKPGPEPDPHHDPPHPPYRKEGN